MNPNNNNFVGKKSKETQFIVKIDKWDTDVSIKLANKMLIR